MGSRQAKTVSAGGAAPPIPVAGNLESRPWGSEKLALLY